MVAKNWPFIALGLLIVVVFAFAISSAMGAPVPDADRQLIIGLLVGGTGGAMGTYAVMHRPPP